MAEERNIRRENLKINHNKQNIPLKQTAPNKPGSPNRPGTPNKPGTPNRYGAPNRPGMTNRPGMPNRPGYKFNGQKSSGIRKPVSPNELLQLQKTNKSEKEKPALINKEMDLFSSKVNQNLNGI